MLFHISPGVVLWQAAAAEFVMRVSNRAIEADVTNRNRSCPANLALTWIAGTSSPLTHCLRRTIVGRGTAHFKASSIAFCRTGRR